MSTKLICIKGLPALQGFTAWHCQPAGVQNFWQLRHTRDSKPGINTLWPGERLCLGQLILLAAPYSCLRPAVFFKTKTDYAYQAGDLTDSRSVCQGSSSAPRCEQSCLLPSGNLLPEAPAWAHTSNSWYQKELGTVMMCIALGTS